MRKGLLIALALGAAAVLPTPAAQSSCMSTLPIKAALTESDSQFATLSARSRGPSLLRVKLGLYSFHGRVMAERHLSSLSDERSVRLRVRHKLGHGKYTLYAEGDPNHDRSCGPKHWSTVVAVGSDGSGKKPSSGGSKGDKGSKSDGSSGSSGKGGGEGNPDDSIPPDQRL